MNPTLASALAAGYEKVVAWADILDRINVYPVPDGDTGRNLVITLSAIRNISLPEEELSREILLSARGNSGNIAARFLSGFLDCKDLSSLADSAQAGRDLAYTAVPDPQPGTILSLFDTLTETLEEEPARSNRDLGRQDHPGPAGNGEGHNPAVASSSGRPGLWMPGRSACSCSSILC